MNRVVLAILGVLAIGALVAAYGCGGADPSASLAAQAGSVAGAVAPVVVACEPGQQAMVRSSGPGAGVSTVACVSTAPEPAWSGAQATWAQPRAIPAAASYPAARPVVTERRVVYEQAPERRTPSGRTWQKSAIIIGSSAGVGAGVGGAVGGKKGALIGAAIGGGSATIWDQATRR